MQAIRSSGSVLETTLSKELHKRGNRYRKNDKTLLGKPDLSFKQIRLVVFVDSEYWHGKDWEINKSKIKTNRDFWWPKIERNIAR